MSFEQSLATGRVAEGLISKWLQARGSAVMPAYEIEQSRGKGPQLFTGDGELVVPDMIAFTHEDVCWVETKHKRAFTWYRIGQCWATGVDLHHYTSYLKVSLRTKLPVWLMFYHREAIPSEEDLSFGCPETCPTGLYAGSLFDLVGKESHRSDKHGKHGMVYWRHTDLRLLAIKENVEEVAMGLGHPELLAPAGSSASPTQPRLL